MANPLIASLLEKREAQVAYIAQMVENVESQERGLVDAEIATLDSAREVIEKIDAQLKPLEEYEAVRSAHVATSVSTGGSSERRGHQGLGVTSSDRPYEYKSRGHFVVDFLRARGQETKSAFIPPDVDARQRVESALGRSITAVQGDLEARASQVTGDTPGLLPEPIVGEIHNDMDANRPFVQSIGVRPLTNQPGRKFRRPVVTQHTTSGVQAAELTALPSRKFIVQDVEFEKTTHGGSLLVSRQDIDWTDPNAWNAILEDMGYEYAADTEDDAAGRFATGVTQQVDVAAADAGSVSEWIDALYSAAVMVATGNGTKRPTAKRLTDRIWTSIDMWGTLGSLLSASKTILTNSGRATPKAFDGDLLEIERVMSPGLPTGTMIVGRSTLTEFYEERVGLLQSVVPTALGIEIGHGGYVAAGFLDSTGFAKIAVV